MNDIPLVLPDDNAKFLHDGFGSSLGTVNYWQHALVRVCYTDGVKDMCQGLRCWCLCDTIASLTRSLFKKHPDEYTQIWRLCVKNSKATLYCFGYQEGVENAYHVQNFGYTDLPDGEIYIKVGLGEMPILCLIVED